MVTWSPSQANGWHPRVWCAGPSDVYVTYGFNQCWLAHLQWTGTAFTVIREEQLIGAGGYAGRWLNPYILSVWQERGDVGTDYWQRSELDVRDSAWSPTVVEGPSPLVGGNWFNADGGHVFEQMGGRVRFDTTVLGSGFGNNGQQAGEWVVVPTTGDHLGVTMWQNGVNAGEYSAAQTPMHELGISNQGDFAYGGYGPVWGWKNGQAQQDLTAVSWNWEGVPFPFYRPNGELWLATCTYKESDPTLGALLRPWGGHLVIPVPGAAVWVHVAEAGGNFFVGTCTDTGGMTLTAAPVTTERVSMGLAETPEDSGGSSVGGSTGSGTGWGVAGVTLTSKSTFEIVGAAEELIALPIEIFPAFPAESGYGRIIHPTLGSFDYEVKPDEWVNIDAEAIIAPVWASTRTLTSAANVLWEGNLRDVVVEERWKALGGLAMPITQLRMLLAIWTTPVDPDVGYVRWFPNYITSVGFKVIPVNLSAGGQGLAFDDVANYKDENGNLVGWMTNPVTFTLKLVERL